MQEDVDEVRGVRDAPSVARFVHFARDCRCKGTRQGTRRNGGRAHCKGKDTADSRGPSQSNGSVGDVVVSGTAREKAPGHRKVSVVEQEEEVGGVWLVGRK